ncbi:MAG: hypothetical protein WCA35_14400 [Kovacikia sp.]
MNSYHPSKNDCSLANLRSSIWILGIPSFLFGVTDRGFSALSDGYVSFMELFNLFTASFFFLSWLYLKPEESLNRDNADALLKYRENPILSHDEIYLLAGQARMVELQNYHLITQKYTLRFPYICQIYHLLNLKHLETVHSFSLNHLKILTIEDLRSTAMGGSIKFQTVIESPTSILKIWRQPIVEVELVLHTPYTVELRIPVYDNRKIVVIFNALPMNKMEHVLLIDIYSNLRWPKFLLQLFLHFASYLTLFEDLPYLYKLAEKSSLYLADSHKRSNHKAMGLFHRFVDLYGSKLNQLQPYSEPKQLAGG